MSLREVRLPDLGVDNPPLRAGVWLARRGDRLAPDSPLIEILAGSALVDLPATFEGTLVEKLVGEDDPLTTGQPLARIETDAP